MRSNVLSQFLAAFLAGLLALTPATAHASLFGEENGPLTALVAQGVAELNQAGQTFDTMKQNLQIAKDVYAGINDFTHFDPKAFLDNQARYWEAQVPLAGSVASFVTDISTNGLRGGSSASLYARLDAFGEAQRLKAARDQVGQPYDPDRVVSVSLEAQKVFDSQSARAKLAEAPEAATVSEGLFESDAARADPQLIALYMQQRATAKENQYQAYKIYSESMGASPGKAQQLAAMALGLSAQELAMIDDKLATSNATQQLEATQRSVGRATERRESELLWGDVKRSVKDNFGSAQDTNTDWVDFK